MALRAAAAWRPLPVAATRTARGVVLASSPPLPRLIRPLPLCADGAWAAARRLRAGAPASRGLATASDAAVVVVDGAAAEADLREEFRRASSDYARRLEVIAVGQPGILRALRAAAELEDESGRVPTFTCSSMEEEEVRQHSPREDFKINGIHNYRLSFPASSGWESLPEEREPLDGQAQVQKLLVGTHTSVMPLAKAIAARSKELPPGTRLFVETLLVGGEESRRLRVARVAHALARAHKWQVSPVDPRRPTRVFRCLARHGTAAAARRGGGGDEAAETTAPCLRVEVLPEGPVGGVVPAAA
eukprot:TRINITY_DN41390_c0_g1_i1.p1 TRINITY_DN41390_c0_g1~~TRINITY_DN41390_c0_g1_i1.p1  ORF type:complete len:329 (+),score=71.44 TRINITY_DN41390_c0_g1_i1:81-989(+)